MDTRTIIRVFLVALLLLGIGAIWHISHAQTVSRDSTVCTAFRVRTGTTGAIISTSITKVTCGGVTTVRVDTVKVPGPTVTVRDTIGIWFQPNLWKDSVIWAGPVFIPVQSAVKPANFALPRAPAPLRDTIALTGVWRPGTPLPSLTVPGGTRYVFGFSSTPGTKPPNIEIPPAGGGTVRVDTVTLTRRDTLAWIPGVGSAGDSYPCPERTDTLRFALVEWSQKNAPPIVVVPRCTVPSPTGATRYLWREPVAGPDSIRWKWVEGANVPEPKAIPYPARTSYAPDSVHTVQRTPYLMDVYKANRRLGYVGSFTETSWGAWRVVGDSIDMDNGTYPSKAAAATALTVPNTFPPRPKPNLPELPRVYLDTRMPPTP